jgi:hypothetical protein
LVVRKAKEEDDMDLDESAQDDFEDFEESAEPTPPPQQKKVSAPKQPVKRKPAISPFLAPLKRIRLEIPEDAVMPDAPIPQNHFQVIPESEFGGSIEDYLASYLSIQDVTGLDERPRELINRIINEAKTFDRIETFKNEGRLNSLNPDKRYREKERLRSKDGDHQDHLLEHATDFSKRLSDERRHHIANCKRISRMILTYFEDLEGREERQKEEEKKRMRGVAKWIAKEVLKKWSLAADVSGC